jgi:hypothetical protein
MNEETITTEEALEAVFPIEAEPEPEPKVYDLVKVQAAYDEYRTKDVSKLSRMEYNKYVWLEEKLTEAGILGIIAWEEEFAI